MKSLNDYMETYKKEVQQGDIKQAYQGLMEFFKSLKTHFQYDCLDFSVTSNIYYGCMDITFISFATELLQQKKLKVAIVFIHEEFRFEIWLTGLNKNIQKKYLELLKANNWNQYEFAPTTKNVTYIVKSTLVAEPNFNNLEELTKLIEHGTLEFINNIESFVSEH